MLKPSNESKLYLARTTENVFKLNHLQLSDYVFIIAEFSPLSRG